jgi:hypothetical protein
LKQLIEEEKQNICSKNFQNTEQLKHIINETNAKKDLKKQEWDGDQQLKKMEK